MIDSVNSTTSSALTSSASSQTMGKDDFLKLLVAQLENQDPLEPTDNTQFVAQLAQFSSLEGITNLNTTMESATGSITSLQNYSTANLIGRNIKAEGNEFDYSGSPVNLPFTVAEDADSLSISVYDPKGKLVNSIDLGSSKKGDYEAAWDGKDFSGNPAANGRYTFSVNAKDSVNNAVDTTTYIRGTASSVSFDSGSASLLVGGSTITQDKIKEIY
ncbi:MAG: hypothetical protein HYS21_07105 [Deltaproteobacteria bacterium]|nr:hypothetical protein [Deltaproteobacteria bacterium]